MLRQRFCYTTDAALPRLSPSHLASKMNTVRTYFAIPAALIFMLTHNLHAVEINPAEIQAIAEEGFIYGLPIVMNYAVMYDYAVDKDSGQFKAPFNEIKNEARVFTYEGYGHRHAQQ